MQKVCKNCTQDFEVKKRDIIFYDQIQVPIPEYCPDCRMQRRLAFRNERTFYKRDCDLCKKSIVSLFPTGTKFPVYCRECWWSDQWDATTFAADYDSTKPFIDQYEGLLDRVPRLALTMLNSVRSEYTNGASDNKDCYLIFAAENNENCLYGKLVQRCKDSIDCAYIYDSELCYECVDTRKSFKCFYSERLQECADVLFSFDMRNCQNCIFCTNGRNLSYCIENKQYSKEDYLEKKAEIFKNFESIEQALKKYSDARSKAKVKYASSVKCHNTTGDYIYNCYDGDRVFDSENSKNSSYLGVSEGALDSQDCDNIYFKPERIFNVMSSLQSTNCIASTYVFYCNQVNYSDSCHNSMNCFGCVGLQKKNYHILNKEYSKEEYEVIAKEIKEKMQQEGIWGEFPPAKLSRHGYNETVAEEYFPISKNDAINKGFNWQDQTTGTYGKETIPENGMPEAINEVTEDILKEVLVCKDCKKNFRITKSELDFYKRMNLPLPRKDFECRHKDRMLKRNPRKLWPRSCMCELGSHQHGSEKCENKFETSYSPEREEVVYCENCYQQEVS